MSEAALHPPYLRRVTFMDTTPDSDHEPPVHVTGKLLLDGVEHGEVMAREGWQVFSDEDNGSATIVSFVAFADQVTLRPYQSKTGDILIGGTHLCGIPVLTPGSHPWEQLPVIDGHSGLIRVFFFAREVAIVAATLPAGAAA